MTIATWNINGIRARLDRLVQWLEKARPDVVCLQEIKCVEDQFPMDRITGAGYHAAVYGQKAFNGVAILARSEPLDVVRGLGDDVGDLQARLIAATVDGVRVLSAYVPNGGDMGSDKYAYKLAWLRRLLDTLDMAGVPAGDLALCGDFNIIPEDRDAREPSQWEGTVLYNPEVRALLGEIVGLGLSDVFRRFHTESELYSWWDYRRLAFPRNDGLRIDLVLCTPSLEKRCSDAFIERDERKGEKPSDHVPVVAVLD
ncbi:MAG: exodeoxyribonuclease III [Deltaproteobacteria bacterium]|nr:exodeoxyribonuclease III [Deltaproteobacteria bacterium]